MEDNCVLLHHNTSYPLQPSISQSSRLPVAVHQRELMAYLDRLKFFLATAPSRWSTPDVPPSSEQHPALNRFLLPSGEYVSCVLWSGLYHITGTDIVRALVFRFEAFGRPVRNIKKFEEGVFSDLRNLKPGHDACLEEPKVGLTSQWSPPSSHAIRSLRSSTFSSSTSAFARRRSKRYSIGA